MELKHVFFSSLLLSATFTACTNEEFTTEISAPVTVEDAISLGEGYTIVGSKMGDAASRAYVTSDLKSALWEKTDVIGAAWYNMATYNADGTIKAEEVVSGKFASNTWFKWNKQIGNDMSTAEFKSEANAMAGAYVLYYPYNESITNVFDGIPVKVAYNQAMDCTEGKELDFVNDNLFSYCVYPFVPGGVQTADFEMKQLTNVFALKFQVNKENLMKLEEPVKITKVILEAKKGGQSVLYADGKVKAPKSTDVDYNKGTYGATEFTTDDNSEKVDHLILDVKNATDAYAIKALETPTEKPFYITALPFKDADEITFKILTDKGEVYATKITSDNGLTAINELAEKEGQIIPLKVILDVANVEGTIYTAEQFKSKWNDALQKGGTLNIGEGVDLSDMDLTIDNNVNITLSGKSAKVKSLNISNGKLTVNNELSVAEDVTIGSNAKGFSTSADGSIAVDGKVAVQGTAGNVKFSKIGSLDVDASGVIAIEGIQNPNSENISEIGAITNEGSLTLKTVSVKTLSNTGTVTLGDRNVTNEGTFTNKGTFAMNYDFANNGTFSQEGTISRTNATFNNNAGATLDVKATTSIKFNNNAATDKLNAAVINVMEGATLTTTDGDNNGIINVTGKLTEASQDALTQTDDAARIIAKSEKAVITRKNDSKALGKGYIVILNNNNYPTSIDNDLTAYEVKNVESIANIATKANNILVMYDVKASDLSSTSADKNYVFYKNINLDSDLTVNGDFTVAGNVEVKSISGNLQNLKMTKNKTNNILKGASLTLNTNTNLGGTDISTIINVYGSLIKNGGTVGGNVSVNYQAQ